MLTVQYKTAHTVLRQVYVDFVNDCGATLLLTEVIHPVCDPHFGRCIETGLKRGTFRLVVVYLKVISGNTAVTLLLVSVPPP